MYLGRIVLLASVLAGCAPRVGSDCTPEARVVAETVVHSRDGLPAYAGQALMITSCGGGGAFCHAEGAIERRGAPFELNFDPELADQGVDTSDGSGRLRRAQLAIYAHRDDIWASVLDGTMPPGLAGHDVQQRPYVTFDDAGHPTPIPGLDTAAGRETLRNWLACGAPVVERTTGLSSATACARDSDCPLSGVCVLGNPIACRPVGPTIDRIVVPIEPTWESIYDVVISSRCNQGRCHGSSVAAAGLDLSEAASARDALLAASANGLFGCAGEGQFIVPRSPDESLFYRKISDPNVCGGLMPRGGGVLAPAYVSAIHDWIAAGAPP